MSGGGCPAAIAKDFVAAIKGITLPGAEKKKEIEKHKQQELQQENLEI